MSLMKKIFKESDNLVIMLNRQRKERPEDGAEYSYKIIVATVLPLLLNTCRICLFLLSFILGGFLARLI